MVPVVMLWKAIHRLTLILKWNLEMLLMSVMN